MSPSPPKSTPWVPVWPVSATPVVPTPIEGYWLKGGPDGAMVWQPAPASPPGIVTPDADWKICGVDVAFQNGWTNYPAPYGPGRYRKLASGIVVMEGLITGGTESTTAFWLPAGWRPQTQVGGAFRDHIFQCARGGAGLGEAARLNSDGNLVPQPGTSAWIDLSGIMFFAG